MRYLRLEVENFRGIGSQEVEFGEGVTVVFGPNEAGKSSLREAIALLRSYKSSSRHQEVKRVAPIGKDVGPRVLLELEVGPYQVSYEKQWLKGAKTELQIRGPGRTRSYTGDEAHARFLELLEETVDLDLLQQLDVQQGASLGQALLADIKPLHQALGESPDELVPDELMDRVEAEFSKYFTAGGKEGKTLKEVQAAALAAQESLKAAIADEAASDALSQQFQENGQRIEALKFWLTTGAQQLETLKADTENALDLEKEARKTEAELLEVQAAAKSAQTILTGRKERTAELQELSVTTGKLKEKLNQRTLHLSSARQSLDLARAEAEVAATELAEARNRRLTAEGELTRFRAVERLEILRGRLSKAEAAERESRLEAELLNREQVTQSKLEQINEAQRSYELAVARQSAAAPRIEVARLGEHEVGIHRLGQQLSVEKGAPEELTVLGQLTVLVEGVAEVKVFPASEDTELVAEVRRTEALLSDLLSKSGMRNVGEAQSSAELRRAAESQHQVATQRLQDALEGQSLEQLRAAVSEAEGQAKAIGSTTAEDAAEGGLPESSMVLVDSHALEKSAQKARELEAEADQKLAAKQSSVKAADESHGAVAEEVTLLKLELTRLEAQQDSYQERLDSEQADLPNEKLVNAIEEAEQSAAQLEQRKSELEVALRAQDLEGLSLRLSNHESLITSKKGELRRLEDRNTEIRALLEERSRAGSFERLQLAEVEVEETSAELGRITERAEAAKLLWGTLQKYKTAAQERYVEPFAHRISELGRHIFGQDMRVEVTPDLRIASRTKDGRTVPFDDLSAGAREQLALIGRLVTASLVDPEEGAPVILDDTLGFADSRRLLDLNVVLNHVGESAQIIILTCQRDRFDSIGGARVVELQGF